MSTLEKLSTAFMAMALGSSVAWAQGEPDPTPPIPPLIPEADTQKSSTPEQIPKQPAAEEAAEVDQQVDINAMTVRQRKLVQQALKDQEVYEGDIDGRFGKQTWAAVREFQQQHSVSTSNGLTSRTLELLGLTDLPVQVVSGTFPSKDVVREAQQLLREQDYEVKQIDGVLGPGTRAALKQFQRDQGIAPSGQLDDLTLQRLGLRQADVEAEEPAASPSPPAKGKSDERESPKDPFDPPYPKM